VAATDASTTITPGERSSSSVLCRTRSSGASTLIDDLRYVAVAAAVADVTIATRGAQRKSAAA
jgi:hypothetical protein